MSPEQAATTAPALAAPTPTAQSTCANCGAVVPELFCGRCGQRFHHELHSVAHFAREVTEDLTHADSRLWRTLAALLLRPGFLTREFVNGRRVRYLPPLRLYLLLSLLFFLGMSLGSHGRPEAVAVETGTGTPSVKLVHPEGMGAMAAKPGETLQQREDRVCNPHYEGPLGRFVTPFLAKGCRNYLEGKSNTLAEAFWHNLPKALFVFLPVLALVMKAMYWHPQRYYIEHLLFFLHNHAFVFLVFGVLALINWLMPALAGGLLDLAVSMYVLYYLYVSMRRVYGQSRWRTFMKLVVLSFAYVFGAVITLMLTAMYSAWSV